MNASEENLAPLNAGAAIENEPTVHELLNEATLWLQYARGVTSTLADLVHEADSVDYKQLGLSLEAVAAMTQAGVERVGRAHARWAWDQADRR
ncbi:hypothetical protein [Luteibacter aegosomatissinici]|uniref:hypothetical protein n=1 Tax=Luteibacter aegosomatissinici TaxID=2911539 RepID=UPI001FFB89DB|nr:hypothetical protein [Luteibacter aegosomatissinici]UPG93400.1 hypothetical protein L2Y97_16320 [Luteibacter aegosomatissinici]